MTDFINFPQCVQTIYNCHCLKNQPQCDGDLQPGANAVTTSLFENME